MSARQITIKKKNGFRCPDWNRLEPQNYRLMGRSPKKISYQVLFYFFQKIMHVNPRLAAVRNPED